MRNDVPLHAIGTMSPYSANTPAGTGSIGSVGASARPSAIPTTPPAAGRITPAAGGRVRLPSFVHSTPPDDVTIANFQSAGPV